MPRATYRVCRETNSGVMRPFGDDTLVALYGTHRRYLDLVRERAAALVAEGWLLPADADEVISAAETSGPFGRKA